MQHAEKEEDWPISVGFLGYPRQSSRDSVNYFLSQELLHFWLQKRRCPSPLLPPADVWARANSVGSASRALPLFPCGWLLNFFIYGPHTAAYEKGAVLFISFRGNKNKGEILRNRIIYLVSSVRNAPLLVN